VGVFSLASRTDLWPHQVGMLVPFAALLSFFACRYTDGQAYDTEVQSELQAAA